MPWAVAASVAGSVITGVANKSTAKTAAKANTKAAETANAGIDKQIEATKQGIAEGDVLYNQSRDETRPGVTYLRNVIAAPTSLTPAQRAEREDLVRRVTNSSQVAGSALRGSGRSFVDAMRAVEGDFTNKALASNQARADNAATNFATPYFNAGGSEAAAHATLGKEVGGALASQGQNAANAQLGGANVNLQANQANANLLGSTIGQVGAEIASQQKNDATRKATYDPSSGNYTPGPGGF